MFYLKVLHKSHFICRGDSIKGHPNTGVLIVCYSGHGHDSTYAGSDCMPDFFVLYSDDIQIMHHNDFDHVNTGLSGIQITVA